MFMTMQYNCYMDIFFSGRDLDRLKDILREDCQFRGPFYQFDSAEEYITSLKADPPIDCSFKIVHSFELGNVVATYFCEPCLH